MFYAKTKRKRDDLAPAAALLRWLWQIVLVPARGAAWLIGGVVDAGGRVVSAAGHLAWRGVTGLLAAPFWLLRRLLVEPLPAFDHPRQAAAYKLVRRYYRRRRRWLLHGVAYSGVLAVGLFQMAVLFHLGSTTGRRYDSPLLGTVAFIAIFTVLFAAHYVHMRLGCAEDEALYAVLERDYSPSAAPPPE
ncbi:MAG: hypothetical protein MUE40_17105 [Anaerolineae bacterium]|jgi:hypothetical protein|nr:hypothetical protein [Anaerolineae bacterium]